MTDLTAGSPNRDPSCCPLCGKDNRCGMERERATGKAQGPCWCVSAEFPPDLLARLPASARGQACICARCLSAFVSPSTTAP